MWMGLVCERSGLNLVTWSVGLSGVGSYGAVVEFGEQ